MVGRITTAAGSIGLIAVLMGVVPTAQDRLAQANTTANQTAAYNATRDVGNFLVQTSDLAILALAAGGIMMGVGVLSQA